MQLTVSKPVVGLTLLFLLVVISALAVVYVSHLNRQQFNLLQAELTLQSEAQVKWGQLLLQHSTLTTPSRLDKIATGKLAMHIPSSEEMVIVKP
ncbi:cell division protein FtsL [Spartinivicinus poritis]|uniref:Cell division protein FtsL n=1 Tax=Spartinivicinus poritis TaxID=2994640 RepID=A0ABT5U8T0_9GAMM|nr:cell division protein FtsL [Spartinivicinus sp. A2-2]MDE1462783.1 cell division protein FtsL [Spartinivicinus sp. A2-2]